MSAKWCAKWRTLGGIDVLVNNAANYETAEFDKLTVAQWDAMFASNTRGPFLVSREALPYLRKRSSACAIVNMGSLGGLRPWATHAHYCSSKAAVHMLTKVMAKALAPEIAVNAVAPGMIDLEEKCGGRIHEAHGQTNADAAQWHGGGHRGCGNVLRDGSLIHYRPNAGVDGGLGL